MADDLQQIRDEFADDDNEWSPIRAEGVKDMQYVAGDPWDPLDRLERSKNHRPCISADEISQYTNQVVNEVLANQIAVKFDPVGNGANDKTARFYQDKVREIEYRSRAQIAYATAFQNMVERSYGFARISARYLHPRAVNQDLCVDAIHNPNLVTPDPLAQMPDLSDMKRCWVRERWSHGDFDRKWGKDRRYKLGTKRISDLKLQAPGWVQDSTLFVGERWVITPHTRTLVIFQGPDGDPVGLFEEEYEPAMGQYLSERTVEEPRVSQQLTNGLEILEEHDWPGKYIPIFGCLGRVLYVNADGKEERRILSMVRLARDPQMLYAYLVTSEAETVSAIPKFPYFVPEGGISTEELGKLTRSVSEPVPVVRYKAVIDGAPGTVFGPPTRNPYDASALAALEIAKESARRMIQAAMGQTPLPTAAQRRNEKSGVALKHIDEQGQRGSFHFKSHYIDMVTHAGRIEEDLIPYVYDTERVVPITLQNGTSEMIRINATSADSISTQGDHLVTVSTGPSFDSERQAGTEFAQNIIASDLPQQLGPEKGPKLIAKTIKLLNLGPVGDEIAEIISPAPEKDGAATPAQLQQQVEQLQAQLQQGAQAFQQLQAQLATDQAKQQATREKAQLDAATDLERVRLETARDVRVQMMRDKTALALAVLKLRGESALQDDQQAHEMGIEAASAQHDLDLAERQARQALQMATMGHQYDLEAGEQQQAGQSALAAQTHQQGLEAQAMQPEAGA